MEHLEYGPAIARLSAALLHFLATVAGRLGTGDPIPVLRPEHARIYPIWKRMQSPPFGRSIPPPISPKVLWNTYRVGIKLPRVISGCPSPPRVWTNSHTPWIPREKP